MSTEKQKCFLYLFFKTQPLLYLSVVKLKFVNSPLHYNCTVTQYPTPSQVGNTERKVRWSSSSSVAGITFSSLT